MQFNVQKFSDLSEKVVFQSTVLLVKNAKIYVFLKKTCFERRFISNLSIVGNKLI